MPLDENENPQRTKKSLLQRWFGFRRFVAVLVLTALLLLLLPFVIRAWRLRGIPEFPEPFETRAILEYSVPDRENAYTDYRNADSLYTQPTDDVKELRTRIFEEDWSLANKEIQEFLDENNQALLAWKQGTARNRAFYLPASEYQLVDMDFELIEEMRELHGTAMLLCLQLEAAGKPQEAWEWYRASIRASRHVGTHGGFIERLVGFALFSSCVDQLETWSADPRLESEDLSVALTQLETDWKLTESLSTNIKIEYLSFQRTLDRFVAEFNAEKGLPASAPNAFNFVGEPEISHQMSKIYVHNLLTFCDEIRPERPEVTSTYSVFNDPAGFSLGGYKWDAEQFEQAMDRSIFAKLILSSYPPLIDSIDREAMRYQFLRVALAAQAYFREHGEFPTEATALVPEYLAEIPTDIYSPTPAPLIYRRNGDGAVVYSRYKNGIDDGGRAVNYEEWNEFELLDYDYGVRIRHPFGEPLRAPQPE